MASVFDFAIPTVVVVLLLECAANPAAMSTVTLFSLSWDGTVAEVVVAVEESGWLRGGLGWFWYRTLGFVVGCIWCLV